MNLAEHLQQLKIMTTKREINFSTVFSYFLTHIGENSTVEHHFKHISSHKILEPALLYLGQTVYGNTVHISRHVFLQAVEQQFLHGSVQFSNGFFWGLYFFEDILSGIACNIFSSNTNNTDFYRLELFTSTPLLDSTSAITPTTGTSAKLQ